MDSSSQPPLSRVQTPLQPNLGYGAALAAILWAIAAIAASELFRAGVGPMELSASRTFVAAAGLGIIAAWKPRSRRWGDWRIGALGISLA